jgi:hypothetical protein
MFSAFNKTTADFEQFMDEDFGIASRALQEIVAAAVDRPRAGGGCAGS